MYRNKRIVAIITARADSKRLPDKNILPLAGKPLIAWTIESAKKSKYLDNITVSTDSLKIMDIAKQFGAEVPFIRPARLSTDNATSVDVVKHALDFYKNNGEQFDIIVLLQPTSPLRTSDEINHAVELMENDTKAIVAVCETEHSPLWSNTLPENLSMANFIRPEFKNSRSQDLPKYYRINGAIYVSDIEYFYANNGFIAEKTKAFIMPQTNSVDIDTQLDFDFCNLTLNLRNYELL